MLCVTSSRTSSRMATHLSAEWVPVDVQVWVHQPCWRGGRVRAIRHVQASGMCKTENECRLIAHDVAWRSGTAGHS